MYSTNSKFDTLVNENDRGLFHSANFLRGIVYGYMLLSFIKGVLPFISKYAKSFFWFMDFTINFVIPIGLLIVVLTQFKWNQIGFIWPKNTEEKLNFVAGTVGIAFLIPAFLSLFCNRIAIAVIGCQPVAYDSLMNNALNWSIPRPVLVVYLAATAGFFEETIYKGILPRILSRHIQSPTAILFISCSFYSIFHWGQGLPGIVNAFIFSSVTFLLFWKIKNLVPFIIGHILYDLLFFSNLN